MHTRAHDVATPLPDGTDPRGRKLHYTDGEMVVDFFVNDLGLSKDLSVKL